MYAPNLSKTCEFRWGVLFSFRRFAPCGYIPGIFVGKSVYAALLLCVAPAWISVWILARHVSKKRKIVLCLFDCFAKHVQL